MRLQKLRIVPAARRRMVSRSRLAHCLQFLFFELDLVLHVGNAQARPVEEIQSQQRHRNVLGHVKVDRRRADTATVIRECLQDQDEQKLNDAEVSRRGRDRHAERQNAEENRRHQQ